MDLVRELVKTIVVIVLLAVFIEMILPRGDMRRYVKMVMGLLVILTVVQTAADALHVGLMQEMPRVNVAGAGPARPLEDIMAAGRAITETNQEEALQRYREGVESQVLALAKLNRDLAPLKAEVAHGADLNEISEIKITFQAGGKPVAHQGQPDDKLIAVDPVVIETYSGETQRRDSETVQATPREKQAAAEVAEQIAQFYNLKPGQVKCVFQ